MKLPSLTFTILSLKQRLKEILNTTNENVAREKNNQADIQKAKTAERNRQYISCFNVFGRRLKMMDFFN
jgi:hypothetical protein